MGRGGEGRGGRRREGRAGLSGNVAEEAFCLKSAPATKPILKLFRPSGSHITEAFGTPCADTKFQGNPFIGLYIHGGRKNWRFSTEIAVYLGNGAR